MQEHEPTKEELAHIEEVVEAFKGFEQLKDLIQVTSTKAYQVGEGLRALGPDPRISLHKKAKLRREKRKRGGHK
jgi:hypothetical protein